MCDKRASEVIVDIAGIVVTVAMLFVVDGSSSAVMLGSSSMVGVSASIFPYNCSQFGHVLSCVMTLLDCIAFRSNCGRPRKSSLN